MNFSPTDILYTIPQSIIDIISLRRQCLARRILIPPFSLSGRYSKTPDRAA